VGRQRLSVLGIFDAVQEHIRTFSPLIVITGGEPFRQRNLPALVRQLLSRGFSVQIETNGTAYQPLPFNDPDLTIVCSPKTAKLNRQMEENIDYYKYIIKDGDVALKDGLPVHALDHTVSVRVARPYRLIPRNRVYVQPCDTQDPAENAKSLKAAIKSCRDYGYTLCLQTHKIINLP
jgi:organic radical activating enzyme